MSKKQQAIAMTREALTAKILGAQHRAAFTIDRAAMDAESKTIEMSFASDTPITHFLWSRWEYVHIQLSMDPAAVRTGRLETGAPLLLEHNTRDMQGVVDSYEIKAPRSTAKVRFSQSARGQEIQQDVLDGIRQNVSVGFAIHKLTLVEERKDQPDLYRADDWEPYEISLVACPADISVGVGRSLLIGRSEDACPECGMATEECTCDEVCPECELPMDECSCSPAEERVSKDPLQTRAIHKSTENNMTPEEIAAAAKAAEQRNAEVAAARRAEVVAFADVYGEGDLARDLMLASDEVSVDDVRQAIKAKRAAQPATAQPAPLAPAAHASREGGVQLARTLPRYGTLRNFVGENAAERAHRFGQWVLAMRGVSASMQAEGAFARSLRFCNENGITVSRAMSEGVNESGGFLVPEEFGNDLIDLREQYGVFRRNAKIVPMSSDSRSDPRRTGGLTAYFAGEGDALTASDKGWDRVNLAAEKLTCLARYSNEVNEDAVINMGDDLAGEIAYAFATKEDACGFIGDGTDTYGGMQGVTTKIKGLSATIANIAGLTVATGTGYASSYGSIVLADLEAVAGNLPVYADTARAKWYCHKSFYWNVMAKLALASGGVTGAEIEGARTKRFLGYDVEFVQIMPKTPAVSQVVALLGDLSLAASFGSRRDTTIAVSEHSRFANDQLEIRGTERFDINVHDVGNQSATAALRVSGPIVGLITAAS